MRNRTQTHVITKYQPTPKTPGAPLFTDGNALANEIGDLDTADCLIGGGTVIDNSGLITDPVNVLTEVTLRNVTLYKALYTRMLIASAGGVLTIDLSLSNLFVFNHTEDITLNFINIHIGNYTPPSIWRIATATPYDIDWANTQVESVTQGVIFRIGTEVPLTQVDGARDNIIPTIRDTIVLIGISPNRGTDGAFSSTYNTKPLIPYVHNAKQQDIKRKVRLTKEAITARNTQLSKGYMLSNVPLKVTGSATTNNYVKFNAGSPGDTVDDSRINFELGVITTPISFDGGVIFENIQYATQDVTAAAGSVTIDITQGTIVNIDVDQNITSIDIVGLDEIGSETLISIFFFQDATGGWTVDLNNISINSTPAISEWENLTTVPLSTAANSIDWYTFNVVQSGIIDIDQTRDYKPEV